MTWLQVHNLAFSTPGRKLQVSLYCLISILVENIFLTLHSNNFVSHFTNLQQGHCNYINEVLVFRVFNVTVIDLLLLLLGEVPVPVLVRKTVCPEQVYRGLLGFLKANALPESQNELRSLFSIAFPIQNSQTFSHAFLTTHAADKPELSRLKSRTKKLKGSPSFLKK